MKLLKVAAALICCVRFLGAQRATVPNMPPQGGNGTVWADLIGITRCPNQALQRHFAVPGCQAVLLNVTSGQVTAIAPELAALANTSTQFRGWSRDRELMEVLQIALPYPVRLVPENEIHPGTGDWPLPYNTRDEVPNNPGCDVGSKEYPPPAGTPAGVRTGRWCKDEIQKYLLGETFLITAANGKILSSTGVADRKGPLNVGIGFVYERGRASRFIFNVFQYGSGPVSIYSMDIYGRDKKPEMVTPDVESCPMSWFLHLYACRNGKNRDKDDTLTVGSAKNPNIWQYETVSDAKVFGLEWSPDGQKLLYFSASERKSEKYLAYIIDFGRIVPQKKPQAVKVSEDWHDFGCKDTPGPCDLLDNGSDVGAWSPKSDAFYYSVLSQDKKPNLRVIKRFRYDEVRHTIVEKTVITGDLERDARFPSVSPDGDRIVFLSKPTKSKPCDAPNAVYIASTTKPFQPHELSKECSMYVTPRWAY